MRELRLTPEIIADPKTKYGSPGASTRRFVTQRVTGAFNILFLLMLLYIVVCDAGSGREGVVAVLQLWFVGVPFAVLVGIVAIHMRNGLRESLEDYFAGATYRLVMSLNTFFCLAVGAVGVISILSLVFWG